MNRRTILRRMGAASAAALAGCLGTGSRETDDAAEDGGRGQTDGTATPTTTPSATPTPTPSPSPAIADSNIHAGDASCAVDGRGEADVTWDADHGLVRFDGAIETPDVCWTGGLEAATVTDGTLEVRVTRFTNGEGGGACDLCDQAGVDYAGYVKLSGPMPGEVVLRHEPEGTVAARERV